MVGDRDMLVAENHYILFIRKNPLPLGIYGGADFKISATIHLDCASIRLRAEKPLRQGFWSHRPQLKAKAKKLGFYMWATSPLTCFSALPRYNQQRPYEKKVPAPSQTTRSSTKPDHKAAGKRKLQKKRERTLRSGRNREKKLPARRERDTIYILLFYY